MAVTAGLFELDVPLAQYGVVRTRTNARACTRTRGLGCSRVRKRWVAALHGVALPAGGRAASAAAAVVLFLPFVVPLCCCFRWCSAEANGE